MMMMMMMTMMMMMMMMPNQHQTNHKPSPTAAPPMGVPCTTGKASPMASPRSAAECLKQRQPRKDIYWEMNLDGNIYTLYHGARLNTVVHSANM